MSRRILFTATVLALMLTVVALAQSSYAAPPSSGPFVLHVKQGGTTKFAPAPTGADGLADPEIDDAALGDTHAPRRVVNRSYSGVYHGAAPVAPSAASPRILTPAPNISFDGLNHRDQRLARHGNQFSLEPPDQGLCVGNGWVMEPINTVVQVYDTSGVPQLNGGRAEDLNSFFGYPAEINRSTGKYGPFLTDTSCYYDPGENRWFVDVLTLDADPSTGDFTGTNHIDLAISTSGDPTGTFVIYRIPAQNDGTQGTPNDHCSGKPNGNGHGPCLADYPHMGADANGFFITTNEYSFNGPEFHSALIYAISKDALSSNAASIAVWLFNTVGMVSGNPGFTVWPAIAPESIYDTSEQGTEYFMSSDAAEEANGTGYSKDLIVWAITNTLSLDSLTPVLSLSNKVLTGADGVDAYTWPPQSDQKKGNFPLGQCLNDLNCAPLLFGSQDSLAPEVESHLDSNDTRMQQVVLADGYLWGAVDTGLNTGGTTKAGVEWFTVSPTVSGSGVDATLFNHGYLSVKDNNLTYPAIAVKPNGNGIMAFTLVGKDHYPTAAYVSIDTGGTGAMQIANEGTGPSDGFTSYKAYVGNPPRTRWGDYGAAVEYNDGSNRHIWIASEYIDNTCTLRQFETDTHASPKFSCKKTRTALGNWDTRISDIIP